MTLRLPKPERRAPKPRKRIARGKGPRKQRKTSRAALGRLADRLFSLIVREQGRCRYHSNTPCAGPLQCAHIVSRIYRSVRWDEDNAMPLCAGAHRYFTSRAIEWRRFVGNVMGEAHYPGLESRALETWDRDIDAVVARLKARAAVLGIK